MDDFKVQATEPDQTMESLLKGFKVVGQSTGTHVVINDLSEIYADEFDRFLSRGECETEDQLFRRAEEYKQSLLKNSGSLLKFET